MSQVPTVATDLVPVEEFQVAIFSEEIQHHTKSPATRIWLVHNGNRTCQATGATGYRLRARSNDDMVALKLLHPDVSEGDDITFVQGTFKYGQVLVHPSVTIKTLGGRLRPRYLYRAVHSDTPHGGIKSRAHDLFGTNGLIFQKQVKNHFNWNCRRPSPFMSTTTEMNVAIRVAELYERQGKQNIEILIIKTTGRYWDHHTSRLFRGNSLARQVRIAPKFCYRNEYLIEHAIPSEHVARFPLDYLRPRVSEKEKERRQEEYQARLQRSREKSRRRRERLKRAKDMLDATKTREKDERERASGFNFSLGLGKH